MNDINPASYLLGSFAILVVIAMTIFIIRRFAMMDKILRLCPNCGGDETFGLRHKKGGTVYDYTCHLCRHQWTWDQSTTYPTVTVRSELIAEGKARRLQEQRDESGSSHGGPGSYG